MPASPENPGRNRSRRLAWLISAALFLAVAGGVSALVLAWFRPQYAPPDERPRRIGRMVRLDADTFRMGNVWEWCGNWYSEDDYPISGGADPTGPSEGQTRALRGGSWATPAGEPPAHTVWARWHRPPDYSSDQVGFRCVRVVGEDRY